MGRPILGWWFGPDHLPNGDGRKVVVGVRLRVPPPVRLCDRGLHGSRHVLDATKYAECSTLWRTRHSGTVVRGDDQLVSSVRVHLGRIDDAQPIIRAFMRRVALDVTKFWSPPPVVREYLETGREDIREDAMDAAQATAGAAWDDGRLRGRAKAWFEAAWAAVFAAKDDAQNAVRDAVRFAVLALLWGAVGESDGDPVTLLNGPRAQGAAWPMYRRWLRGLDEMCLEALAEEEVSK